MHSIKQKGQLKKLTTREKHSIARKVKENPRLSAPKLAAEVQTEYGKQYLHKQIVKSYWYNGRVAHKKSLINKRKQQMRLNFAREHILKDQIWWNDVIFLDESKYNLFGSDARCMVCRKPKTELLSKNIVSTVEHGGGSVMV